MSQARRILFLSTQLPYPPVSGGVIKSWHYLKHLSEHHEVSLACLLKNDDEQHLERFQSVIQLKALITEPLSIDRSPVNLLKSYLLSSTLNAFRNRSSAFAKKIAAVVEDQEVIIVDHYELFQYVPRNFQGKVILHTHNAEFALWQRMAEIENKFGYRQALREEAKRVKKEEVRCFKRSDLIYASPNDIQLYAANGFNTEKLQTTYHLGNADLLTYADIQFEQSLPQVVFTGTLGWEPNVNGLLWLLEEVWSICSKANPEAQLLIIGKKPDPRLLAAAKAYKNVQFTGFVEDLESVYAKARVSIIPLRFGSGMKVKLLESMYRGIPAVSTTVGAEGIEVTNGEELYINDDPEQFAQNISDLLNNESTWTKFRDSSRKLARERYTWEALFQQMDQSFNALFQAS